jgi:hypothetical protein
LRPSRKCRMLRAVLLVRAGVFMGCCEKGAEPLDPALGPSRSIQGVETLGRAGHITARAGPAPKCSSPSFGNFTVHNVA